MKDIVIVANFCRDFSESDNGRFMYLCKELSKDNKVEIITSDFSHSKKGHKGNAPDCWPFKITFLHEPGYKKNISIKRFISHYRWGKNVIKYLESRIKPDVVYCAVPSLTAAYLSGRYCEKHSIRFIIDIQDLWPEAFQMVFHIPIISSIVFTPFKWLANSVYRLAGEIIAVSQTYVDRAMSVNKKCKEGHPVFLGTDLTKFDENVKNNPVINKPIEEMWIGYCGTLGASYDLNLVFDAMRIMYKRGISNYKFIIMGSGPREEEFKENSKGLNVQFTGKLLYPQMCGLLAACDIVVNPIKGRSAASIINKHGDYASAGKPVINTQTSDEYVGIIEKYNMGISCLDKDPKTLAIALEKLVENQELRISFGQNARKCAEELFNRRISYRKIVEILTNET